MPEINLKNITQDLALIKNDLIIIRSLTNQTKQNAKSAQEQAEKAEKVNISKVFDDQLKAIRNQTNRHLQNALSDLIIEGRSLKSVFRQFALSFVQGLIKQSLNINPFAAIKPFARGGILGGPTLLPLGGGALGLAGEAGAEAVIPLARGADGRLGVRAQGAQAKPVIVHVHIQTPDIASFQRSQTQMAAVLKRAVSRGQRNQ